MLVDSEENSAQMLVDFNRRVDQTLAQLKEPTVIELLRPSEDGPAAAADLPKGGNNSSITTDTDADKEENEDGGAEEKKKNEETQKKQITPPWIENTLTALKDHVIQV
jgi:ribosomal protein L12E/L44/L45/RPP1/RPP2